MLQLPSRLDLIDTDYRGYGVQLYVKRDDLIHPWINGNKWRKLKENILLAEKASAKTLISFGGAFSNHLVALAAVGYYAGIDTVGIVRSYHDSVQNWTIDLLSSLGMNLHFVHPDDYSLKEHSPKISEILDLYNSHYLIPEGGTNAAAVQGTRTIWEESQAQLQGATINYVAMGIGTAGTIAGVANAADANVLILGGSSFKSSITDLAGFSFIDESRIEQVKIIDTSRGRRFGRYDEEVVRYINGFSDRYKILLEPIYTAPLMMKLDDMIHSGEIAAQSSILFVHTGGLQGIVGYNQMYPRRLQIAIPDAYDFLTNPATTLGKK